VEWCVGLDEMGRCVGVDGGGARVLLISGTGEDARCSHGCSVGLINALALSVASFIDKVSCHIMALTLSPALGHRVSAALVKCSAWISHHCCLQLHQTRA
jgi:hypothetical protein